VITRDRNRPKAWSAARPAWSTKVCLAHHLRIEPTNALTAGSAHVDATHPLGVSQAKVRLIQAVPPLHGEIFRAGTASALAPEQQYEPTLPLVDDALGQLLPRNPQHSRMPTTPTVCVKPRDRTPGHGGVIVP
jgi:hypothetical protein